MCGWICNRVLHLKGPTLEDRGDLRSLHSDRIAEWYMKSWRIALLCLLKPFIPHNSSGCNGRLSERYSYSVFKVWRVTHRICCKWINAEKKWLDCMKMTYSPHNQVISTLQLLGLPGLCVGSSPSFQACDRSRSFLLSPGLNVTARHRTAATHVRKNTEHGDGAALPGMNIPASHTLSGDLGAMCRHISHC